MKQLSLAEFDADAWDSGVRASPDVDGFCSGSEWTLAAREAWSPKSRTFLARGEHGSACFLRSAFPDGGEVMTCFDTMWGFSSPLVGADADALAAEFVGEISKRQLRFLGITGIRDGSRLAAALADALESIGSVRVSPPIRRWVASLEGGVAGFLGRRSAKLRANLKRAARRAKEEGIAFESARGAGAAAVLARAGAVETRSWKGPEQTGLCSSDLRVFYEALCGRLAARGRLRAIFAKRDGEDVGYILGGVRDGAYRGFQFSFDARLEKVSLGGLLQLEQIAELESEGARAYDLGMDLPYKRHWAEGTLETVSLLAIAT